MEKMKLKDLINIRTGKLDANASSENGKYPFFTCSKETLKINTYSYDCECVLLAGNGDLNVKYYNGKFDAYQRTYILECKNDIISTKYLYYFMKKYLKILRNQSIGGVIKYIKLANISEAIIPIYSKEEQEEIVNNISKVEEMLNIKNKQIEELQNFIKSQFVEMFELEKYELEMLGGISNFIDYRGKTPTISDDKEVRIINAKSVGKGFFKYIDEYITEELYEKWMKRGIAFSGDVLFVTEGHTFGNTCLIPDGIERFALGQRVITIQGKEKLNNIYLCYYMQLDEFINKINMYKTGGTAKGIRSKDLAKITIPIPPITLQNQFSEIVKQIDKQKFESMIKLDKENRIVLKNIIKDTLEETNSIYEFLFKKYFEKGK